LRLWRSLSLVMDDWISFGWVWYVWLIVDNVSKGHRHSHHHRHCTCTLGIHLILVGAREVAYFLSGFMGIRSYWDFYPLLFRRSSLLSDVFLYHSDRLKHGPRW
jgi:hypothetical protein